MTPFLFGLAAACLVLLAALGLRMLRVTLADDLDEVEEAEEGKRSDGPFVRLIDRIGSATQSVLLGIYGPDRVARLARDLRSAGQPADLTAQVFIQREAGFITLGLLLMLLAVINGRTLIGVGVGVLFMLWMHAWLFLTIRSRQAQIERELPDFLDVLAVTVAAGLPFRVAMQRVSEHHDGPLSEELATTLREMKLGVPRRMAMESLRARNRSDNVASFVTALLQAEELGTPLADALRQISAEVRRERAQQVRRAAAKAQPKVSVVVTMTIVPGAIVLIVGGMLIANAEAFSGLFGG